MATDTGSAGATIARPADVGLRRDVGLIGAIWSSETSIIGSGWLFAGLGAAAAAGAAAIYGWIIGGVCVVILALVHAELGGMYPVAGGTARRAEFFGHGVTASRIETGQRLAGKPRQMIKRLAHHWRVAAERRQHVGLNGRIIGAGHLVFAAGGNDHGRRPGDRT